MAHKPNSWGPPGKPRLASSYRGARRNKFYGRFPRGEGNSKPVERLQIHLGRPWAEVKAERRP